MRSPAIIGGMSFHAALSASSRAIGDALRDHVEPLPRPDAADFGAAFERFADARILLLGEATHGTHEFYAARAQITRRLVEHHGFNIIAIEGDWPDIARFDHYVRHGTGRPAGGDPGVRFPAWMWRNEEMRQFADWLRGHNAPLAPRDRAAMYGLDIYSLGASAEAVIAYLDAHDPAAAIAARERYGCLSPWRDEPQLYGRVVTQGKLAPCEPAVVAQLRDLLARRMELIGSGSADGEAFFGAEQNARVVRAAEHYYRAMYRGAAESWNLRDRHMFDTLQALLAERKDARAIVWAHNSHVGNAAATAMGWRGEFNIGELVRGAYRDRAVSIGFGTDRGRVAAASDWGGAMEVMAVRPARDDSWEAAFRHTGVARGLVDWRSRSRRDLETTLSASLLERAIGVVYRPQTELASHYFEAVLADQFDAYVWFEETGAVTPLAGDRPQGVPETWPFGL